jgi:hypothetical protein
LRPFWFPWVGLPWELGADPRLGRAACCFRTAQATREAMGLPWPVDRMADWYRLARGGAWDELRRDWGELTRPIDRPIAGGLILFDNGTSFGVGVLPTVLTFITVRHNGRLIVGPTDTIRNPSFYRLRIDDQSPSL